MTGDPKKSSEETGADERGPSGDPTAAWVRTDPFDIVIGRRVYSRGSYFAGRLTGTTRRCQLESCSGTRLGVRWDDKSLTWPCSKGMRERIGEDGALEIV